MAERATQKAVEDDESVRRYECEHCGEQGGDDVVGACYDCDTDCCRDNCAIWKDGEMYCPDCSKDEVSWKDAAVAWDEKAKNMTIESEDDFHKFIQQDFEELAAAGLMEKNGDKFRLAPWVVDILKAMGCKEPDE